jgi:hypothetical protein
MNEEYINKLVLLFKPFFDKYLGKPIPRSVFILLTKNKVKLERSWNEHPSNYHILEKTIKPINCPYMAWETDSYIILGSSSKSVRPWLHGKYVFLHIPKQLADKCITLNYLPF